MYSRATLTAAAFMALAGTALAQIPAPVVYDGDRRTPAPSQDYFTTGGPVGLARNVEPLMGEFPDSPTVVSDTRTPYVSPNIPPKYVAPPPPPPPAAIRSIGQGHYMILPAESPLLTAPMATLNAAMMAPETETAIPILPTAPAPVTEPPAPLEAQPAPILTQSDLAGRISDMADRLERVTAKTEEMEARAAALESETPSTTTVPEPVVQAEAPKPATITATIPYVNDAGVPGPKAQAAIKKMAEQLKAAPRALNEGRWSVTASVQAPPIGTSAAGIAQERWTAVKEALRAQGLSLPETPPAMVVVRTRGAQYLKLTLRTE